MPIILIKGFTKFPSRNSTVRSARPLPLEPVKEGAMKLYVGNLSYTSTEDELRQAFEAFGNVDSVDLIKDRYTGESKGFGFVEMTDRAEAQ
ncbi:MAG TPA: hypothetical protein VMX58_06515, partial [Patescibacteria group bacterium]|nr:hypothetical protein [Patescibacteria group bacterium]